MNKCIKCGKFGEFEALCSSCFTQKNPLLGGFKDINISFCIVCNKVNYKGKWLPYEKKNDAIIQQIKDKLKFNQNYEISELKIKPSIIEHRKGPGVSADGEAELKITAYAQGFKEQLKEKYKIPISINYTYCNKCSKSGTSYFAGTLQIRNPNQKVKDHIEQIMNSAKKRGVFVTNVKETKSGIDYFITNNSFVVKIAKELQGKFGGELKISAKLHTQDRLTSKEVHRLSVLLRLPDYLKGDIILLDKDPIKVTKMGKRIMGMNLATNKRTTIDVRDTKPEILKIHKTSISKTQPNLEALHPETYQSTKIENPVELKSGQKVKVVVAKGKLFLISY